MNIHNLLGKNHAKLSAGPSDKGCWTDSLSQESNGTMALRNVPLCCVSFYPALLGPSCLDAESTGKVESPKMMASYWFLLQVLREVAEYKFIHVLKDVEGCWKNDSYFLLSTSPLSRPLSSTASASSPSHHPLNSPMTWSITLIDYPCKSTTGSWQGTWLMSSIILHQPPKEPYMCKYVYIHTWVWPPPTVTNEDL